MLGRGERAPDLEGLIPDGPLLLSFVKTDCPACHLALRCLDDLGAQFGDPARVVVLSQDDRERTAAMSEGLRLQLPARLDAGWAASAAFGFEVVPALFLIDGEGLVAGSCQGFDKADLNRLAANLSDLLGRPRVARLKTGDGTPDFQPGCVSRHVEPESDAEPAPLPGLYDLRSRRASRVEVPQGVEVEEFCYQQGFADPLPVVPPTVERVDAAIAASGLEPAEVVAHVPPNYAPATVEKIAANAVMAGCLPSYMRVLVPAIRALCDERLDIHGVQGTTHFAAPLAIVNGPVRREMGFACGSNVFSNAARPNSAIGRAIQLVLRNLGGAFPGNIDMSTMGNPGRFSYVIGESEERSPWGPLASDFGVAAGRSAVTFFCAEPPRAVSEHKARRGETLLRAFCPVLANVWSHRACGRSEALVVVGPEHAATLQRSGFSKRDVVQFLYENTGIPVSEYDGDGGEGTHEASSYEECVIRRVRCYRKFARPESIRVMVAGGPAGKFSVVLGSWAIGPGGSQMVCHEFA